jgi:lipopolysaccharide heptosyltransferase I
MTDDRFLIVKLSSLGDLIFTLPAVAALRQAHPEARIDWVVARHWYPLLEGNPDVNNIVILDRASVGSYIFTAWRLRTAHYTCAIDLQGLYKSAVLARLSGAPVRVGLTAGFAREPASALLYTRRVAPRSAHMVQRNMELVAPLGAADSHYCFPLRVRPQAHARLRAQLAVEGLNDYFVLSPGGGWRSKCWPPDRYGELHRGLARRTGLRGVISFGPGERDLAEAVRRTAGEPEPAVIEMDVAQLMALVRDARFLVSGDSGPLHLAVAFGTPVVGLYGPTDPERNGPFGPGQVVVRNARPEETTFRRGRHYSPSMLSITVDQVLAAVERRIGSAA